MKKRKLNWKNIILVLLNIIFIITLTISIYKIINWKIYSDKTKTEITTLQENIHVEEVQDTKNTEIIEQPEKIPKKNPYWDYINMNMINVDFNELKKINQDVIGLSCGILRTSSYVFNILFSIIC